MDIHGPSLAIGAGIAVVSILAAFIAIDITNSSSQPLKFEEQEGGTDIPAPTPSVGDSNTFSTSLFLDNGSPILGNEDAPITLVEFGDYQCFFCNKFFHETEESIVENYVKTGKVKMIFKDFTIIGQDSVTAALGAHCASDQGKFWEFHDELYLNWDGENNGWASFENVQGFAKNIELDMDQFTQCLLDKKYQPLVAASTQDARTLGITGTPAFFIIGTDNKITRIPGAQPYEVFRTIFDGELEN